ncbi:hypothetical protein ACLOJK_038020 [Asimina triloba]
MPSSLSPSLFSKLFSFLLSLLFPLVLFSSSSISTATTAAIINTNTSTYNYNPPHQKCVHQHLSALLQLKRGFDLSYSDTNLSSWNANNPDCCSWEGIHCSSFTGHVIALNLSRLHIGGLLDFQSLFQLGSLQRLNLSDNFFEGSPIPSGFAQLSNLTHLHLRWNQFYGQIPLDIFHLTRSNNFFGSIGEPWTSQEFFPRLQIIDLSFNNFSGRLPSNLFSTWKMMKDGGSASEFLIANTSGTVMYYQDTVLLVWKGTEIEFEKIIMAVTVVDLSHNQFHGDIPTSIGELKALRLLNLSHNHFQGKIIASLQNLRDLESLDLSNNNLSGKIPWQLAELSFLAVLNLSQNQLIGRIPQSRHFDTFQNDSFLGNSELCGLPLSRECEEDAVVMPPATQSDDEESELDFMWIAFGVGYGVGFGMFFWTLALWRKGRRAFLMFVDRVFFSYFSSIL